MPAPAFTNFLQPATRLFKRLATIQPKEAKLTVGLDVGSSAVKVIVLGARKGVGPRPIVGQRVVAMDERSSADPSEAIKTAMAALQAPTKSVNLSVSGQWVVMRIVEMPNMKPAEMKQALPFEAQRYLPFNPQDVVIDGAALGPADANKSWVLIVACKKELIERRIDWVKRAGFEPELIDVDALALANGFLAAPDGRGADQTHALIDIGAQLSNLVIFKGEAPYLVRDIPWGGEKLLRSVAEQLGREAAALKAELAKDAPDPQVVGAMKAASEALVTELQLSFDYFENRFGQPPDQLLVSGGLAQMAGVLDALKSHVTQKVSAWTPVKELPPQFAVAYGLALRTA